MNSEEIIKKAAVLANDKKAEDIIVMDVRKLTIPTDYMLICTGRVSQHLKAIQDNIVDNLRDLGAKPWHIEGTKEHSWILLDYVNVVIHIFLPETREFYSLERLWGDAEILEMDF